MRSHSSHALHAREIECGVGWVDITYIYLYSKLMQSITDFFYLPDSLLGAYRIQSPSFPSLYSYKIHKIKVYD